MSGSSAAAMTNKARKCGLDVFWITVKYIQSTFSSSVCHSSSTATRHWYITKKILKIYFYNSPSRTFKYDSVVFYISADLKIISVVKSREIKRVKKYMMHLFN